jgi:uncharacterized OB-fold protein
MIKTLTEPTALEAKAVIEALEPPAGTVYTDTVVFSAPEAFVADAPYQIAIVDLDAGGRLTVRIEGDLVAIGDRVELADHRNGIPFFRRIQ